jgi:hypothetical protein
MDYYAMQEDRLARLLKVIPEEAREDICDIYGPGRLLSRIKVMEAAATGRRQFYAMRNAGAFTVAVPAADRVEKYKGLEQYNENDVRRAVILWEVAKNIDSPAWTATNNLGAKIAQK